MIDITDKNLVVMQDTKEFNGAWKIFENEKIAKKIMAMDSGTWKWIGYIFTGWKYIGTEEVKDRDSSYKAYIHSYLDIKGMDKYISEIICEPNEHNKASETYTICKVFNHKPGNNEI